MFVLQTRVPLDAVIVFWPTLAGARSAFTTNSARSAAQRSIDGGIDATGKVARCQWKSAQQFFPLVSNPESDAVEMQMLALVSTTKTEAAGRPREIKRHFFEAAEGARTRRGSHEVLLTSQHSGGPRCE